MENSLSKESDLKFTKQDFRELSAPDNILNVWIYNHFDKHKPCFTCDIYSKYCEEVLKEEWRDDGVILILSLGKLKTALKVLLI